jgi:hypothetical protein
MNETELKPGDEVTHNGIRFKYMGNGKLVQIEEEEPLIKRFDEDEGLGTLHGNVDLNP